MKWSDVGDWIKDNAGTGAQLIGSLLTGNVPGAVAAGVSLVSDATGTTDPKEALANLQTDPTSLIRLKELEQQERESIRKHLEEMTRIELEDEQHQHAQTQKTVRSGDNATDKFVRWTRPGHAWISLIAGIVYAFTDAPNTTVLTALFTLPFSYAGLRQIGKSIDAIVTKKANS